MVYATHWLKEVNPMEALIENWEKELIEWNAIQEISPKNSEMFACATYKIKEMKKFINDLKSI